MTQTIPLLHDNHNHVSLYASFSSCLDISRLGPTEALNVLQGLPEGDLTVVRGWKSFELPMTRARLAALPPLLLINFSLHGFAVSDSGVPFIERTVPEIASKRFDNAWCEAHVPELFAAYCGLAGLDEEKLVSYIDALVPLGIGSSDEMTVPTAAALDRCESSSYADRMRLWVAPNMYKNLDIPRRERLAGVKLYLDGAIGGRSAAIRGSWIGGGAALFTYSDDELEALVTEIMESGAGLAMHAIGELAIEQAIRALERAALRGVPLGSTRIEHVQFIDKRQAERVKKLGATLSMQPNFSSDSRDYADRLPPSYLQANNPFRMLIDELGFEPGRDLIFGSDGMPDGIAYAAKESLFPVYPSQRLSLEELVAGYGPSRGVSGTARLAIDERRERVTVEGVELSPRPRRTP